MFDYQDPIPDELVTKYGRTTGARNGFVNAARSTQLQCISESGSGGDFEYRTANAWVVIPERWHNELTDEEKLRRAFSLRGDSGAAVFNQMTYFKGLLFGGVKGGDMSYFTPVQDLFEDIKRTTDAVEVQLLGAE